MLQCHFHLAYHLHIARQLVYDSSLVFLFPSDLTPDTILGMDHPITAEPTNQVIEVKIPAELAEEVP
jgi:hypothetical protein